MAYRIAFETRERIIATPLPADDGVRYPRYADLVAASPDPAFVLLPPRSDCFDAYLREGEGNPTRTRVGAFTVFEGLPRGTLELIRRTGTLPLPKAGYAVSWQMLGHPSSIPAGGQGRVRLRIRNDSPCVWMPSVHLGLHWQARHPGANRVEAPFRAFPWRLDPGQSHEFNLSVPAPPEPGVYIFEYDLVQELVTWFAATGAQVLSVEVQVGPHEKAAIVPRKESAMAGTNGSGIPDA